MLRWYPAKFGHYVRNLVTVDEMGLKTGKSDNFYLIWAIFKHVKVISGKIRSLHSKSGHRGRNAVKNRQIWQFSIWFGLFLSMLRWYLAKSGHYIRNPVTVDEMRLKTGKSDNFYLIWAIFKHVKVISGKIRSLRSKSGHRGRNAVKNRQIWQFLLDLGYFEAC